MTVGSEIAVPGAQGRPTSSRAVYGVLVLSAALVAATGWLLSTTALNLSARQGPWWIGIAILVGFGLAERFAFHMEYRRETMSFTLSEVPAAFALVFLGPVAAIVVRLVGSLTVFFFTMRPARHKLALNGALFSFETALTFAILQWVCDMPNPSDGQLLVAIAVALAVASFVGSLVVSVAIACFEGRVVERLIAELKTNIVLGPVSATVAAMALAPALVGLAYVPLAVLPVAAVWFVLRQNGRLAERHRNLSAVHDFTRRIGESIQLVELVPRALDESMQLLRADAGSIDLPRRGVRGGLDILEVCRQPSRAHTPRRSRRPIVGGLRVQTGDDRGRPAPVRQRHEADGRSDRRWTGRDGHPDAHRSSWNHR